MRVPTVCLQSVQERIQTDMEAAGRRISRSRVYTIHGAADEVIPVADAHAFDRCIQQHVLRVLPGVCVVWQYDKSGYPQQQCVLHRGRPQLHTAGGRRGVGTPGCGVDSAVMCTFVHATMCKALSCTHRKPCRV